MIMVFLSALAVGFSGSMMPGPLLTYTIRQALNHGPLSGFIIITGHAILELLLIILIFLGFDIILQSTATQTIIGIVGGLLLIYMGGRMIYDALKKRIKIELDAQKTKSKNMVLSGMAISAANPYFIIWWAVIGLGLLLQAYQTFGIMGIVIFYIGHITADFIWYGLVSVVIGKTRKFIKEKPYRIIIAVLGGVLIYFGISFFYYGITNQVILY
jgi:threonine/homoserine/homoserine lactone efflux protein